MFIRFILLYLYLANIPTFLFVSVDKDFIIFSIDLNYINTIFSIVVMIISWGVYFYRNYYFNNNMILKYKINLIFFIISIIILINRGDLFTIVVGWDGLGISSYFLVSYYSEEIRIFCGMITFFINRIGDRLIIIFIGIIIFNPMNFFLGNLRNYEIYFILIGLITKRAQLPFGVWLPIAMSAPTPISSLVHSSTLVTSGLYFIMKINFLLPNSFKLLLILIGIITFIRRALFSFLLIDIKKAVALSTLSQLGIIFFSISIGYYLISFYHLIIHAFFKSRLFVNLGYFMLSSFSIQDIRLISKDKYQIIIKLNFYISCIRLIGFLFSLGFISKDLILVYFNNYMIRYFINFILYLGCIFTGCYRIKIIIFSFKRFLKYSIVEFNTQKSSFILVFFISFVILIAPLIVFDLLYLDYFLIIPLNPKLIFYRILLNSLIISFIISYYISIFTFFISFSFSYLLNCMYNSLINLINRVKYLSFILIKIEDSIQLTIFYNLSNINQLKINSMKLFYLITIISIIIIFWLLICLQQIFYFRIINI